MAPPRNAELWRLILDSRLLDVHTALPAEVVSFDATSQTITAQPMIKNVIRNMDGSELVESYPPVRFVPVQFPRGGGFTVCWPLSAGDKVLLAFCEWSIDNYLSKGREDHPVDLARHSFQGAVAFPMGPYAASDTISESIDGLVLGHDSGAVIRIKTDGTIVLAKSGETTQPVALANSAKTELEAVRDTLNSLVSVFNAHTHPVPGITAGSASTTSSATLTSGTPPASVNSFGSSKVQVQE